MSQPEQPVFPQDAPQMDIAVVEKRDMISCCYLFILSFKFFFFLTFFTDLWRYLIYHRLGRQSLSNVLKVALYYLPVLHFLSSYIDLVAAIWYSDGPSVYTHLARRTASDKARVQDISWSIWTQTA
ncbi:hypothetical protein OSTOST_18795, partial [Ostertagia ostertagi]